MAERKTPAATRVMITSFCAHLRPRGCESCGLVAEIAGIEEMTQVPEPGLLSWNRSQGQYISTLTETVENVLKPRGASP